MKLLIRLALTALTTLTTAIAADVRLEKSGEKWTLLRDGKPYFIKGAGGDAHWELLAKIGGNSVRTWGHEKLGEQLGHAQKLGLTVTAGIWLGQVRQGFDWTDTASLLRQRETVRAAVMKHKNHPALLMWSLGNEMEDPQATNGAVWNEINGLARMVKTLDPSRPVMTVIAEIGGKKISNFHALCPDVDILGINSYAGAASVADRYAKLGGTKPYALTEFGPPGIWEVKKDAIGAFRELNSTEKAEWYRNAYRGTVAENPLCVGSYAFLWGQKQEVTATWFSMVLADGTRLAPADAMSEMWTGTPPANRCPQIAALTHEGPAAQKPGSVFKAALKATDPDGDAMKVEWSLFSDEENYGSGGDKETAAAPHAKAVLKSDPTSAEIRLPDEGGLYRVFATVRDSRGGAAVANIPVRVDAPVTSAKGAPAKLPLVIYAEDGDAPAYAASGWMGDTKAMKLDPAHRGGSKTGATSLRCEFSAPGGWGAIAWQSPPQDWGDQRGGFDLTGAKRLVFDARGEAGGEEVTFGFGTIGKEKKYFDTAKRSLGKVKLTREWQQFEIRIEPGDDLTRIKTGFLWSVAGAGQPLIFHLDNVRWE